MSHRCVLLAFALGVFLPNFFLVQPSLIQLFPIVFFAAIFYRLRTYGLLLLFVGLVYGVWSAHSFSNSILAEDLNNQKFTLRGALTGIPERRDRSWKIDVIPDEIFPLASNEGKFTQLDPTRTSEKIRLSLYESKSLSLKPGDRIQAEVRLRRPHGLMNPGLFDYQRWLIARGYGATGYISNLIELHSSEKAPTLRSRLDRWRLEKSLQLQRMEVPYAALQSALTVGDRSQIQSEDWDLYIRTGTVHLMVISGLHIGFVAGLAFFICRWVLGFISPVSGINAPRWANMGAIFAALAYAAAAGFTLPTLRALIMVAAFLLPRFFLRSVDRWWSFSLALALVSILDPKSVLQTGFWLSFGAVALIFLSFNGQKKQGYMRALVKLQLVFLVGFAPMIIWLQGYYQPISFVANLVAVPMVSLIIVPLELFGLLLSFVSLSSAEIFWRLAGWLLHWQNQILKELDSLAFFELQKTHSNDFLSLIAVAAGLSLFYWKQWWQKSFALMLVCTFLVRWPQPDFVIEIRIFDVGQGLSILVRQPGYSLLYDTGPKFSERFDAGTDIIAPTLHQLGISKLDDLVISHTDTDHLGGYPGLKQEISYKRLWLGRQPETEKLAGQECLRGKQWRVGEVSYQFLSPMQPDTDIEQASDNNRSCVLQINFGDNVVLFPGDISRSIERELLQDALLARRQNLVIMPHHGSKSSSGYAFVDWIEPDYAVASAGYLNRFNHPDQAVVKRYESSGAVVLNTAQSGMLRFSWQTIDAEAFLQTEAEKRIFWWQK